MGQALSVKRIVRKKSIIRGSTDKEDDDGSISNLTKYTLDHERLSYYRSLLTNIYESDFSAPVEDVLTLNGKIMEAACGSGTWSIRLAYKYPNSEFIGLDLNPIIPKNLPRNLKFVKENILSTSYEDEEFDFLRIGELQADFTEVEYELAIHEMIRITKRGGWIEINELSMIPKKNDTYFTKLIICYRELLELRGINLGIPEKIQFMLYSTNKLQDIQVDYKSISLGPKGGELGIKTAEILMNYFKEVCGRDLADHLGLPYEKYLQTFCKNVEEEFRTLNIVQPFYRVWGQKK